MAENFSETIDTNPEVLPPPGIQPIYDIAYNLTQGVKAHLPWFVGGVAVGAIVIIFIYCKTGRKI